MPTAPISMRKLKEILRLKYGCLLSHSQIAKSLSISSGTVSNYAKRAAQFGLRTWPIPDKWDDVALSKAFFETKIQRQRHAVPDWSVVHVELKHKTMTL